MPKLQLAIFEDNSFVAIHIVERLGVPKSRYEIREGEYCSDCQTIIHPHYKKATAECDCTVYNDWIH